MNNLWEANHPSRFWLCQPDPSIEYWQSAIRNALPILGLSDVNDDIGSILSLVLGEEQFGPGHWQPSLPKRLYYLLKPILPTAITREIRRLFIPHQLRGFPLGWPIENRYARFQWEVIRQLRMNPDLNGLSPTPFWPDGHKYALVLTHDIETIEGQANIRTVADLEERLGFRSSINFVPERYPLDPELMTELRERGFEIGVHGLKHDGKLFSSKQLFDRRSDRINCYLEQFDAVGFRAPLFQRNPEWLQSLNIEYDLSFFDTDPFEPCSGGTMSIWPFHMGKFIELPLTLVQDHTLHTILEETTIRFWLEKVDCIERYQGMALLNTHPDYLTDSTLMNMYSEFLEAMKGRDEYWHDLPKNVARWWRERPSYFAHSKSPE